MANKPLILLTNDDGIHAPGMTALREAATAHQDLEVIVVAPLGERSGTGCGLSLVRELRVEEQRHADGTIWGYAVDGMPADCVKIAMGALGLRKPDLVLSGINSGYNVGNSIFYSGTCACAIEATFFGLRAMATSLSYKRGEVLDFAAAGLIVRALIPWLLTQTWQPRTFWNLNVPNGPMDSLGRIRSSHQGTSFFVDNFQKQREEEGVQVFRNVGNMLMLTPETEDCDDRVLERRDVSLSLLSIDLTVPMAKAAAEALESQWAALRAGK